MLIMFRTVRLCTLLPVGLRGWFQTRLITRRFGVLKGKTRIVRGRVFAAAAAPTLLGLSFMESLMLDLEYHIDELAGDRKADRQTDDGEGDSELILAIKRGILAMWRKQFSKAEKILHVTLKMAQDMENRDAETYIFDLLANVYYHLGNVHQSEMLFREVMQREMQKGRTENDLSIIDMSLKMAELYGAKKQEEICQDGLDFCLAHVVQRLQMPDDAESEHVAVMFYKVIDSYARFYLSRGAEKQCRKLYDFALSMCSKYPKLLKSSSEYPHILNNAANVLMLQGEFEAAQKQLEEAVILSNMQLVEPDNRAAAYMVNLGQVYLRRGDFMAALEMCRKGTRQARSVDDIEAEKEGENCLKWAREKKLFDK